MRGALRPVAALLLAAASVPSLMAAEGGVRHIATLLDGPSPELEARLDDYRLEIEALTRGELDVRFEPRHQRIGDWTQSGVLAAAADLLGDPDVDVVVALGVFASQIFCCRGDLETPVVAPVVLDADLQGFPVVEGRSGIENLSFVAMTRVLDRDIEVLTRLLPVRRLVFLSDRVFEPTGAEFQADSLAVLARQGIEASYVYVDDVALDAARSIPHGTDAVYVFPLHRFSLDERAALYEELARRGLPTFSWAGREEVERGALVGSRSGEEFHARLSRRVALNVQRILLGEAPESLETRFEMRSRLWLNVVTADAVGVSPPWELLLEAEQVGAPSGGGERYSLASAERRAVDANLDLLAGALEVEADAYDARRALAALLPTVELQAQGVGIDEDRAASPLFPLAERSLTGSISLRQALWSEPLVANLAIRRSLQESREAELAGLRQDIAQTAADAYLGVLRARTVERIRRENLALSRSNQELARVRLEIGSAIEAEVIRWESRIATDLNELVEAGAQRRIAEMALRRLLHRPLTGALDLEEGDLLTGGIAEVQAQLLDIAPTPRAFDALTELLVDEGLGRAPELELLSRLADAKARELASARRAYWSPRLGLSVSIERLLDEDGAGAGRLFAVPGLDLAGIDDTDRTVALSLSMPLFEGGDRALRVAQLRLELEQVRTTEEAARERVELRVRAATTAALSSFHGIRLSRDAADAAARNLELVRDAYGRGALPIVDLLDAQSAALVADLAASDAVHRFLLDRVEVDRAIGHLDPAESRESIERRIDAFRQDLGLGSPAPKEDPS